MKSFETLLHQRFACKAFKEDEIAKEDLEFILEAGRLSPSSCGFEPWKFIVLSRKHNKALSEICFKQENVATASANIAIVARTDLQSKDEYIKQQISRYCKREDEKFNAIVQAYTYETNALDKEGLYAYAKANCYLALMQMALAAISKGIDSCMIGGFEKDKLDQFLGLQAPFESAVILSLGYRLAEPKHSKKRLSLSEVVEYR
ncbi:nitroreductase family protein [Helicobacter marmotae]|uniref:NAD(P)H-dependent oxidoreductase n=1 Tax=Helicobacter marmotae TaxID=152490 RepID=A0A3D8I2Q2_9HELI|nr:nitroreductase family protein [Helicobacter marmotae]RDU59430.1 NAD(P)H-dependent oxidoreductase [Helicobacter marmotae]